MINWKILALVWLTKCSVIFDFKPNVLYLENRETTLTTDILSLFVFTSHWYMQSYCYCRCYWIVNLWSKLHLFMCVFINTFFTIYCLDLVVFRLISFDCFDKLNRQKNMIFYVVLFLFFTLELNSNISWRYLNSKLISST